MAKSPKGIEVLPRISREAARVLTADALRFVADLHRAAGSERQRHMALRVERQALFDKGHLPDFRADTAAIRDGSWKAAAIPRDLLDLRGCIVTGPSRKDLLAALNSGAKLCLADFADFTSPTWDNLISGQINLMDRWTSAMEHVDPVTKKRVSLSQRLASLMVRPRALHQDEPRVKLDGKPVAAGIFDAGLYLFHNAKPTLAKASGPYLCLPQIESRLEARMWNDILLHAQSLLGLAAGTIRAHVQIDSVCAAFEMEEIAYELREHLAGFSLAASRYGFSVIRSFGLHKPFVLADAGPSVAVLSGLLIRTAHRRGLLALASLTRGDAGADAGNAVREGFDGLWTSHPDQVQTVTKIFNADMPTANQLYVTRDEATLRNKDILGLADGARSEAVFKHNLRAALLGFESWLSGRGTVLIDGVHEDAASAEFRRAQVWQWLRHGVKLDSGGKLTDKVFEECLAEALKDVKLADGRYKEAAVLLKSLVNAKHFEPDFTVPGLRKLA